MRFVALFLLGLFLLTSGCGGANWHYTHVDSGHINQPQTIPIYIDWRMPKEQVNGLMGAIGEWNTALNGFVTFKADSYFTSVEEGAKIERNAINNLGGIVVWAVNSDDDRIAEDMGLSSAPRGVLAFVPNDHNNAIYLLEDRVGNYVVKNILLHEFGHTLGLYHIPAASLMYSPSTEKVLNCIDKITMAEIAEVRKLPLERLNYCRTPNFQ